MTAIFKRLLRGRHRAGPREVAGITRTTVITMLHVASLEAPLGGNRLEDVIDLVRDWREEEYAGDTAPYVRLIVAEGVFISREAIGQLLEQARAYPTDVKITLLFNATRALLWSWVTMREEIVEDWTKAEPLGWLAHQIGLDVRGLQKYAALADPLFREVHYVRAFYPYLRKRTLADDRIGEVSEIGAAAMLTMALADGPLNQFERDMIVEILAAQAGNAMSPRDVLRALDHSASRIDGASVEQLEAFFRSSPRVSREARKLILSWCAHVGLANNQWESHEQATIERLSDWLDIPAVDWQAWRLEFAAAVAKAKEAGARFIGI